jgi:hypothetical protein
MKSTPPFEDFPQTVEVAKEKRLLHKKCVNGYFLIQKNGRITLDLSAGNIDAGNLWERDAIVNLNWSRLWNRQEFLSPSPYRF